MANATSTDRDFSDERSDSAPLGVRIVCVILAVGVPWDLLLGGGLIVAPVLRQVPVWTAGVGILTMVLAVMTIPAVYGLWAVTQWGWQLGLTVYLGRLVVGLAQLFTLAIVLESIVYVFQGLLGLVVGVAVVLYLGAKRPVYDGAGPTLGTVVSERRTTVGSETS